MLLSYDNEYVFDMLGNTVATCTKPRYAKDLALIANSHSALVSALESFLRAGTGYSTDFVTQSFAIGQARAALALAKGE